MRRTPRLLAGSERTYVRTGAWTETTGLRPSGRDPAARNTAGTVGGSLRGPPKIRRRRKAPRRSELRKRRRLLGAFPRLRPSPGSPGAWPTRACGRCGRHTAWVPSPYVRSESARRVAGRPRSDTARGRHVASRAARDHRAGGFRQDAGADPPDRVPLPRRSRRGSPRARGHLYPQGRGRADLADGQARHRRPHHGGNLPRDRARPAPAPCSGTQPRSTSGHRAQGPDPRAPPGRAGCSAGGGAQRYRRRDRMGEGPPRLSRRLRGRRRGGRSQAAARSR